MPDNTTELIDRYLTGTLDAEMRQRVETRLASDAGFREEVDLQRRLMQQVRLYNRSELRRKLTALPFLNTEPSTPQTAEPPAERRLPGRSYVWVAAASILVLAATYGLWQMGRSRPATPPPDQALMYRVPLYDTRAGLGFGRPVAPTDSLVVRLVASQTDSVYVFATDTLVLLLKQPPPEVAGWAVARDPVSGRYVLEAGGRRYVLEKGFQGPRPLRRQ